MLERVSRLRLPQAKDVEVVLLRLPDGRIVARTREELEAEAAPAGGTSPGGKTGGA